MNGQLLAILVAQANEIGEEPIQRLTTRLTRILEIAAYDILLPGASILVVLAVILAGFRYIQGDAKGGKTALIAAITGTVLILISWMIIYVILPSSLK